MFVIRCFPKIEMPPQQAIITSVDAIEAFRSNLITYLGKARPTLEEISADVERAKQWLQNDQRRLWESELRKRGKKLEQAQNELFSAKLSVIQESSSVQFLAKQRAEREVREAETKMVVLKRWDRELEPRADPLLRQVDSLHDFLTVEMPRAVAYLTDVIKTLEAYGEVKMSDNVLSPLPPTSSLETETPQSTNEEPQ